MPNWRPITRSAATDVIDASTVVGAALKRDSVPRRAILKARQQNVIALSNAVEAEIRGVLARPKFANSIADEDRHTILALVMEAAVRFEPTVIISDCRDRKDNIYLELAVSVGATVIISSDADLLDLDPWRGVRVLTPRAFLDFP
jgi:putative PIN family toxin of toxin-antitoxin system